MRPRFMNRGSTRLLRARRPAVRCFNEAPIHESGKFRRAPHLMLDRGGFNEAPIHESGKFGAKRTTATGAGRFNEAPIHESGKSHVHIRGAFSPATASMRPRFMNRGSRALTKKLVPLATGFNEAPIHESGKYCSDHAKTKLATASMRPRFMNRGSAGEVRATAHRAALQ